MGEAIGVLFLGIFGMMLIIMGLAEDLIFLILVGGAMGFLGLWWGLQVLGWI